MRPPASKLAALLLLGWASGAAAADPPAIPLRLDQAVERALKAHPSARAAAHDIEQAEAVRAETRAGWLPSLVGQAGYTRLDRARVLGDRVLAPRDQLSASATLRIPLLAPQRWAASAQASREVTVARAAGEDLRRDLAATVARTFLSTQAQRRVVEIAERAVSAAAAHQEFAARRLRQQYGSRLDEVRAGQETAVASAALAEGRARLYRLQLTLGSLVGVAGPVEPAGDADLGEPPRVDEASLRGGLAGRADVELARRRLEAAEQLLRDDWVEQAPVLLGEVQPFVQRPATPSYPARGWLAQLSLTWPLFEGGLRLARRAQHRSQRDRRQAELDQVLLEAGTEARAAASDLAQARIAREQSQQAATLADEARALAVLAYREGASTNLEVIDAERRARDAGTAAALSEEAFMQALLDLLSATGRFPGSLSSR